MGESLGSLYSYIVYMIAIVCCAVLVLMILEVYFFFGGMYAIQDGLKNDPGTNRDSYYNQLFNSQVDAFDGSGVIAVDEDAGIIKYQIVYNGHYLHIGPAIKEEYISF